MTIWLQSLAHCSPVRRKDLCFAFALNLESGGNGHEPIRRPVEDPCLQEFIKSGHDEDS